MYGYKIKKKLKNDVSSFRVLHFNNFNANKQNNKKSCECYLSNINLNYRFFAHIIRKEMERKKWQERKVKIDLAKIVFLLCCDA